MDTSQVAPLVPLLPDMSLGPNIPSLGKDLGPPASTSSLPSVSPRGASKDSPHHTLHQSPSQSLLPPRSLAQPPSRHLERMSSQAYLENPPSTRFLAPNHSHYESLFLSLRFVHNSARRQRSLLILHLQNYGLVLSLKLEKHLKMSGIRSLDVVPLEDCALHMACDEVFAERDKK